jgi:hypothetical protein
MWVFDSVCPRFAKITKSFSNLFSKKGCTIKIALYVCNTKSQKQNTKVMKYTLKKFKIWIPTNLGIGCYTIKANNFDDAFLRLSKKDKMKNGWIENENGEDQTFEFILGTEKK